LHFGDRPEPARDWYALRMVGGRSIMHITDTLPAAPPLPGPHVLPLPEHLLAGTASRLHVLGLDARALARSDRAAAVAVLRAALRKHVDFVQTGLPASDAFIAAAQQAESARFFLAGGTLERSCDRALRGLDQLLARLGVEQLDLWQLHDLQRPEQLEALCQRRGALAALVRAREEKRVRFVGLGGDSDPQLLLEAMRRFDFDTLTLTLRPGDRRFDACRDQVLPQARRRGMGVIALPGAAGIAGLACARYALSYLFSLPVDLVVLPCTTIADLEIQVHAAAEARPFSRAEMARIDALLTSE
jgi:hypothetical protein